MTIAHLQKMITKIGQDRGRRQVVIKIHGNNVARSLSRTRQLVTNLERKVRIEKLELAVKQMGITRSWV